MGRYFMPSKEAADDFESQAKGMGLDATTVNEGGDLYVITDDADKNDASRDEYSEQLKTELDIGKRQSDYERIMEAKRDAERAARDDLDDALPDESPIGKSQEELDEMERREDERLGRDPGDELEILKRQRELERAKRDIRVAKRGGKEPRDIGKGVKSAMNLLGVGKVNKKALGLYSVNAPKNISRPGMYSGDAYAKLRELTSPKNIKAPTVSIKGSLGASPLMQAATQGTGKGLSPLSIAALGTDVNSGVSPLAQAATKINIKASKIGQMATNPLLENPAAQNTSLIARIAKQSATIKTPSQYGINMNKLKRR